MAKDKTPPRIYSNKRGPIYFSKNYKGPEIPLSTYSKRNERKIYISPDTKNRATMASMLSEGAKSAVSSTVSDTIKGAMITSGSAIAWRAIPILLQLASIKYAYNSMFKSPNVGTYTPRSYNNNDRLTDGTIPYGTLRTTGAYKNGLPLRG